ncbi:MAG: hydrogenase small subunit [Deferrisomatales bacterium]|nr:hydrogenase small subunit [Deferrisomatales bacterium]
MAEQHGKPAGHTLEAYLASHGVSRRSFLQYCTAVAATLGLPLGMAEKVAAAVGGDNRPSVLWLHFQECTGDTEALLRASRPTAAEVILDYLSVDYHETLMAAAGHQVEAVRNATMAKGGYIAVVEGAIPTGRDGAYCCIGGHSALDIAREVCGNAAATICVGTCSAYGGIQAAYPNPTGAVGVGELLPHIPLINLPGCPLNTSNLTATIVHYLTFGSLPRMDAHKRPLFAYGKRIHDNCERRGHFDAGQYTETWGDEGHRQGWCLYKMGCKGPATFHNCPTVRYNDGLGWPVAQGHGCVGCSEPQFWDSMGPIYERLPNVPGFGVETSATKVGLGLVAAAAAGVAVHGVAKTLQLRFSREDEES